MKRMSKYYALGAALFLLPFVGTSCTDQIEAIQEEQVEITNALPDQIVAILAQDGETRVSHELTADKKIKNAWEVGDVISVSPNHQKQYANTYQLSTASGAIGTFTKVSGTDYSAYNCGVYYPGDKIKSWNEFGNFKYTNQVQKKSAPTAHLKDFHSMMTEINMSTGDASKAIDFSSANQSSCIHLYLSGQTFENPQTVSLSYVNAQGFVKPIFYETNYLGSWYNETGVPFLGNKKTAELSLGLNEYTTETSLDAYLMASNASVTLPAGGYLLVRVKCASSAYFSRVPISVDQDITGGKVLNINCSKWYPDTAPMSTDYSKDGEVVTIQEPNTSGSNCLDLVIMGDGFIDADFPTTYDNIMRQAWAEFSAIQPINKFKNDFNVYYVKAVSPQRLSPSSIGSNGALGNGTITKFSSTLVDGSTAIDGNTDLIREYAKKAFATNADERIKNATIVVMVNAAAHAGTCHNSWSTSISTDYGEANAIAFCALGKDANDRKQLMWHEICGHGFGKLADEYSYSTYLTDPTSTIAELQDLHTKGIFRNVDAYYSGTTTTSTVYWKDLISTYATRENLGVFEGAYTYCKDFCRPTEVGTKSIMNQNTGCFNAPSRRQIYYRIHKLLDPTYPAYGTSTELNNFITWDTNPANFEYPAPGETRSMVEVEPQPNAPAVWIEGSWVNGRFIEGKVRK